MKLPRIITVSFKSTCWKKNGGKVIFNIILNYNGDDDYNEAKNQFFTAKDGTRIPIFNTNTGFADDSNRALDVFINGRLNNTIILNTSLTRNDKGTKNTKNWRIPRNLRTTWAKI